MFSRPCRTALPGPEGPDHAPSGSSRDGGLPPAGRAARRAAAIAALAALAGVGGLAARSAHADVQVPHGFVNETVVGGLHRPNSFAFLPDGRVLVTEERRGWVRLIVDGHVAATDPVLVVPDLNALGLERGLQGIAVDPGWPARPYVYLLHNRTGGKLRLVRYTASGDLANPAGESLALGTPLLLIDDAPDAAPLHNGGCLRFGPDGHLFASLGDDEQPCAATDSASLRGQILRLRVDDLGAGGGAQVPRASITAATHPLATADSNAKLVWAYGFRNPWRFHVDPESGLLYVADPRESSWEEYHEVQPGARHGWPYREGPNVIERPLCPEPDGPGLSPFAGPIATFPNQSGLSAINGAGVYRAPAGAPFPWPPEYEGSAFFGDHYHGFLRRIVNAGGGWAPATPVAGQPAADAWAAGLSRAVDFLVGADGSLWWLSQFDATQGDSSGSLQRIRHVGGVGVTARPQRALVLAASPIPFDTRVVLSFSLARPAAARLTIHDLAGRRLRRLVDGWTAAGERRVDWDGRDESGRRVPPGLYVAELAAAGRRATTRIVRVR